MRYKRKVFLGTMVLFGLFLAISLFEIGLRYSYPYGIWEENKTVLPGNDNMVHNFSVDSAENFGKNYNYLGEDIYFWYEKSYNFLETIEGKRNIVIIGDSVAQGETGGMGEYKFSKLLNDEGKDLNMLNFARGGHNISQEYVQYKEYISKLPLVDTVIYVYYNNDIYFSNMINGKIYISPVVIDSSSGGLIVKLTGNDFLDNFLSNFYLYKYIASRYSLYMKKGIDITDNRHIYDTSSNLDSYKDYLINRFFRFISSIYNDTKINNQRFIIIISPTPDLEKIGRVFDDKHVENNNFKEHLNEDNYIASELTKMGIEVYNLYDYGVQENDYFVDSCCHLNKDGHRYYANFIKKILGKN